MSEKKISELLNTAELTEEDVFPIVQNSLTKKIKWLHIFDTIKKYIATSLSTKLNKTIIVTESGTDLDNYIEENRYVFSANTTPKNIPYGANGWLEVLETSWGNVKQFWYTTGTVNNNDFYTYVRTKINGVWSNWKKFQMVEDSGWISLTLNDGFSSGALGSSGDLMYRKINGIVYIKGSVNGFTEFGKACATLPSGYRPATRIDFYGTYAGTKTANCTIGSNGNITILNNQDSKIADSNWVAMCASFVADN